MKKVVSLAISKEKGVQKLPVEEVRLIEDFGVEGDAHGGPWHRQVSFLASERIEAQKEKGLDVGFGAYAENIATVGIDWPKVPVGTKLKIGKEALLEITQIGKKCHTKCAIYKMAGDCIMPREGVFARVLKGGTVRVGDEIEFL
ncbi:MOSC domain protein [Dissulfuribacter thermophilus]|uniref:MOSC domain protein n=1 Tax=Dissulfuribacter thermophilus TaxID=1156395 RepID=A0A1B9F519_9BACT|nr:MOSC domain-containing protein [Dissulfuribacter thermophilus]OCC14915.1 MOSC domain protein [Dissulfuribacter thermophilus]